MKPLKFIHITKCAGTSIENLGKEKNINWGRFHKEYGFWHEIFPLKEENIKLKYDWFMVVRNPYERLISEFFCNFAGKENLEKIDDLNENDFNLIIKKRILNRCRKGNHYTEQHKYLDENIKVHIIYFENLEKEFNQLMNKYGINIKINKKDNACKIEKKFNINSFQPELIKLINRIYHLDFIKFGYKKISLDNL